VVSFTPLPLYPEERTPGTHWIGGWVGPRAGLDDMEKGKFLTLPGLKLRPLGRQARSRSLYRLRYPGSSLVTNRSRKLQQSNAVEKWLRDTAVWWNWIPWYIGRTWVHCTSPGWCLRDWSIDGTIIGRKSQKYSEKTFPSASLSSTNPKDCSRIEPSLQVKSRRITAWAMWRQSR
jgi:hypothetical protein